LLLLGYVLAFNERISLESQQHYYDNECNLWEKSNEKISLVFSIFISSFVFPFTTYANPTDPKENMDIFMGTLTIQDNKAILTRCDIAQNEYVLKDADWSNEKAVSGFSPKPRHSNSRFMQK
jgi:hypothetical protein